MELSQGSCTDHCLDFTGIHSIQAVLRQPSRVPQLCATFIFVFWKKKIEMCLFICISWKIRDKTHRNKVSLIRYLKTIGLWNVTVKFRETVWWLSQCWTGQFYTLSLPCSSCAAVLFQGGCGTNTIRWYPNTTQQRPLLLFHLCCFWFIALKQKLGEHQYCDFIHSTCSLLWYVLSSRVLVIQSRHRKDKILLLLVYNHISYNLSVFFQAILFLYFSPYPGGEDRYQFI